MCAAVAEMDTCADFARDSHQCRRAMCLLQCVCVCVCAEKFCCNATGGLRSRATAFVGVAVLFADACLQRKQDVF